MKRKIITRADLEERIVLLENRQKEEGLLLKEQFKQTYESLKPLNMFRNRLRELAEAPDIKNELLNAGIGLAKNYLAKKAPEWISRLFGSKEEINA